LIDHARGREAGVALPYESLSHVVINALGRVKEVLLGAHQAAVTFFEQLAAARIAARSR
jgi:hypothetical protein